MQSFIKLQNQKYKTGDKSNRTVLLFSNVQYFTEHQERSEGGGGGVGKGGLEDRKTTRKL